MPPRRIACCARLSRTWKTSRHEVSAPPSKPRWGLKRSTWRARKGRTLPCAARLTSCLRNSKIPAATTRVDSSPRSEKLNQRARGRRTVHVARSTRTLHVARCTLHVGALVILGAVALAQNTSSERAGGSARVLTAEDVRAVLTVAATALADETMAAAVVDRTGNILRVYVRSRAA